MASEMAEIVEKKLIRLIRPESRCNRISLFQMCHCFFPKPYESLELPRVLLFQKVEKASTHRDIELIANLRCVTTKENRLYII